MLQKILFESSKIKTQDKSSPNQTKICSQSKFNTFSITQKILYHKYSKFEYSFSLFCTNNLIFNEKCRIVARFKDFLVLDDSTEFLRRFYSKKELKTRLKKIYNFYDSYCKIFPNYMILPESQFLYRNIRKKQKMIDAFNEIKKEEEENRRHLKLGIVDENLKNKEQNVVFTKKIQESIERYHPSLSNLLSNTFMSEIGNNLNNEIQNFQNNDKNSVTISLNSQLPLNIFEFDKFFLSNRNSFLENNLNDNTINSQNSILKIVQILNNNNIKDNNKNTFSEKNNNHNKINKIEYNNNNISQFKSKKIMKKNDNNIKPNTKILISSNDYNTINSNSNSNKNINLKINKINNINNLNNHSNNKKQKQENKSNKRKFISHKQTVSVPIASHMLNNNDNNILEEKNTIKIINNINNIIINDDKNKTINNGMIININNNYYQLKDPKKTNNKMIKRIKNKDEPKKEKSKPKEKKVIKDKIEKDDEFDNFKIFREKRTNTTYNTNKKNKKNLNKNQSPNKKKDKDKDNKTHNNDNKKNNKNINSNNNYFLTINNNISNTNKYNNVYRNTINYQNENKKKNKRYIESTNTYNESLPTMNNNNHNATEINNNYKNIVGNKIKISINKKKEKPKLEVVESLDNKKMSINRKIVNNYLTTTNKKKTYQGKFTGHESTSLNTYNNLNNNFNNMKNNKKPNDISEKIEVLNIYNTIQNKNNPIKFKLDKKDMIRKTKTNSVQIDNKKEFLSSFNLQKEKLPETNIEIDVLSIENNLVKYNKNSKKKFLNNKTQSNSEAKLIKDINNKNNILNAFTSKSLKKDNLNNNNDKKKNNNDNLNANDMKKINVKEMKEKYHKLLRGNKVTHGSYDTTSRLHILKKFRALNNPIGSMTRSINKTIISNKKRSPVNKKNILSPSEKNQNTMSNYIKSPIQNKFNLSNKNTSIENYNVVGGNKFHLIGKKNKQVDTNNKKMKFLKK